MSVTKRTTKTKGTTYVVRWRDPKPHERTFSTRAAADRFERNTRHALDQGTYIDPAAAKTTFAEWHARWWPTMQDRAPNTISLYKTVLSNHVLPQLGPRRLGSLQPIDLEEWLSGLRRSGLGPSTVRAARTLASMILGSAVKSNVIRSNPAAGLRLARPASTKQQALTAAQVEHLTAAIDPFWRPLVSLLAYAGLRPGEAAALRRRHLDDLGNLLVEAGAVEVRGRWYEGDTKTHKARVVPLTGSVLTELRAHMKDFVGFEPEAPIFCTPGGSRLRLSNFRPIFERARDAAGLPGWATPYSLRHTAASLMAQAGVPATSAAALLGHDPAIFVRTYAHLYPDDLRAPPSRVLVRPPSPTRQTLRDAAKHRGTLPVRVENAGTESVPSPLARPTPLLTCPYAGHTR